MRALTKTAPFVILVFAVASSGATPKHELGDVLNTEAGRHYSQDYINCYDSTITGQDRFGCATDEAALQDRKLNTSYRLSIQKLRPTREAALRRSQRAWIVERDRKCHVTGLEFSEFDPSDDASPNPWCVMDMTILRRVWIERQSK